MKVEENNFRDFHEYLSHFLYEVACWHYLIDPRWPEYYVFWHCQSRKHWLTAKHKIYFRDCGKEFPITSGTIFEESKKPLLLWFHILWWVVVQKAGACVYRIKDFEGLYLYGTAWLWQHKLRHAMARNARKKLSGIVAVKKILSGSGMQSHELLSQVYMQDSSIKLWICGTHQEKIVPEHLVYYLDEFAFRYDRRLSTHKEKLFYRLMQQVVANLSLTYYDLIN